MCTEVALKDTFQWDQTYTCQLLVYDKTGLLVH
jgi:hypothetical protein